VNKQQWPEEIAHLPVCPKRGLPIPAIAEIGPDGVAEFTILDHDKARQCVERRLCAMCFRPMGQEVALIGDEVSLLPGGMFIEPPVHERCGEIAMTDGPGGRGVCPFMAGERVPRRAHDDTVATVGITVEELTQVGRTIPKRPWVMAVTRAYVPVMTLSGRGSAVMVYQAVPADSSFPLFERVRRFAYGPDGRLSEVAPRPPARVIRTQRTTTRKRARRG
jgi:hypothetical protein